MNVFLEALLFLALVGALFFGGNVIYSNSPGLQATVGHISQVFSMIAGNMKNLQQSFPVYDLAVGFGAIITTETIKIGIKIAKFFIKFKSKSD
jgi:hypothetical protein